MTILILSALGTELAYGKRAFTTAQQLLLLWFDYSKDFVRALRKDPSTLNWFTFFSYIKVALLECKQCVDEFSSKFVYFCRTFHFVSLETRDPCFGFKKIRTQILFLSYWRKRMRKQEFEFFSAHQRLKITFGCRDSQSRTRVRRSLTKKKISLYLQAHMIMLQNCEVNYRML